MSTEADRLQEILESHHVSPDILESGLDQFSEAAKNEVAARMAAGQEPPQALARLPLIRTPENEDDIAAAMRAGLQAPEPAARKFAIYGLATLGLPEATDAALAALADGEDEVVVAAASVLLEHADDPQVADALRSAYESRAGQEQFHASVSMLKARLIEPEEPA